MSESSKDPRKSGSQPGKRPAATIDLQATELERRDLPGADSPMGAGEGADTPAAMGEDTLAGAATMEAAMNDAAPDKAADAAPKEPEAPSTRPAAAPAPRRGSGFGGFVSHMLAGVVGAGIVLFGGEYLANTFGVSLPTYSAAEVDQLTRRIAVLEQAGKEHAGDAATSFAHEQLDALKVKADQMAQAVAGLGSIAADEKQLADRTAKLEQTLSSGTPGSGMGERVGKLEDQFKTLALSGAAGQAGSVGTMAVLMAKVEGMGTNLDTKFDEVRKSLLDDSTKQSAYFAQRLSEVDKSADIATLTASGKALGQQIVDLRADADKLHQDIATLSAGNDAMRKDLATLQTTTADLKTKLETDAATFAKSQQLSDVNATASKLQSDIAAITAKDKEREQGANRILLTLQLANLKRAVEGGGAFVNELAEVKRLAPAGIDLSVLDASADKGLPPNTVLLTEFKALTWKVLGAETNGSGDGSLLGELWQGARSVVQVRRTDVAEGDSTEAILARTENKLQNGDLAGTMQEISQLKGDAHKIAEPWIAELGGRLAVDQAIAKVDTGLAKLMGPAPGNTTN